MLQAIWHLLLEIWTQVKKISEIRTCLAGCNILELVYFVFHNIFFFIFQRQSNRSSERETVHTHSTSANSKSNPYQSQNYDSWRTEWNVPYYDQYRSGPSGASSSAEAVNHSGGGRSAYMVIFFFTFLKINKKNWIKFVKNREKRFSERFFLLLICSVKLVFCYQSCSDLLWEKNVLVIEKNFWNSRLKAKNLQNFWDP